MNKRRRLLVWIVAVLVVEGVAVLSGCTDSKPALTVVTKAKDGSTFTTTFKDARSKFLGAVTIDETPPQYRSMSRP